MDALAIAQRYSRLFGYMFRFSATKALEFRVDFFFRIVMDFFYYAVNLFFFEVLFLHFPEVAGWDRAQMRVFVAGFLVADAIHMAMFTNNLWMFPLAVSRGELDSHLVRPVSPFFFLLFKDIAINSLFNVAITLGILGWALSSYPAPLGVWAITGYLLLLLNGSLLLMGIQLLFVLPVFWSQSVEALRETSWTLSRVLERPDGILKGWARKLFVFVLPYCAIASLPARALIGPRDFWTLPTIFLATLILWSVVGLVWRMGLRSYSSASS